ncbi:Vegetative incompatibility protein HET-E-1 [Pseudocercospora fuligena]|uniref:Vegetative incompatibility protein HET-E-1 n=1 Tax=Pseudocercospora fuligena TaxID=685502 RepID=A0A8H6REZ7_9PEZI|nr:Vegetative incompatibility protein HET-E-1 [Pseudocercospora fuligena]
MDRPSNLDVTTTFTETTVSGGNVHFGNHFGDIINYEGENGRSTRDHLRSEALRALYWTDPEVDLTKAEDRTRAGRTPGTCEWILENEDFKMWQKAKAPQLLLITGEPGIGKTVLATFLVDHFKKQSASMGSEFTYFFCMNAKARQSTGLGILRGLLLLLLKTRPALCDHLLKEYPVKGEDLFESIESLWPVFEAVIMDDSLGDLVLQIDGLDECEENSRDLLVSRFGGLMRRFGCKKMKVVITSRVIGTANELASHFSRATLRVTMDIGKVNRDLQRFIESEVDDIATKYGWDADLKAEVTYQVKSRSGGTFVWVSLALKTVSKKRPHQVIHELSKVPLGLQHLYARMLHEIPPDDRDMVYRVLVLVIGADKPMCLDELSVALHFYPDESGLQTARRRLPTNKEMDEGKNWVQTCAVFLRIAEDGEAVTHVSVFHLTLKEFLTSEQLPSHVSNYHIDKEQASKTLLAISTAYLLSEELHAVAIDAETLRGMALKKFKYRELESKENTLPPKKTFRRLKDKILRGRKGRCKEMEGNTRKEDAQEQEERHRQFELCKAWSEVEDRHLILLESAYQIQRKREDATATKDIRVNIFDPEQKTQSCYSRDDLLFVLRLLIEDSSLAAPRAICVIWRFMSVSNWTVPWWLDEIHTSGLHEAIAMAARSGRFKTLEAFVRLRPLYYLSPSDLFAMAMQTFVPEGKPPVQEDQDAFDLLFLTARLDHIPDRSPLLHSAGVVCCSYLVNRCIESGDQVSSQGRWCRTPLHHLAEDFYFNSESEAILCAQLMLDADPERTNLGSKDVHGRIPLHCAAQSGHLKVLQLLINAATDCSQVLTQDNSGQVPLHNALEDKSSMAGCSAGHFVAALLQADHEKRSLWIANCWGQLPIHYAAREACVSCVKRLVEADITRSILLFRDHSGRTPLEYAQDMHKCYQKKREEVDACDLKQQHYGDRVKSFSEVLEYLNEATADAQRHLDNMSLAGASCGSSRPSLGSSRPSWGSSRPSSVESWPHPPRNLSALGQTPGWPCSICRSQVASRS